MKRKNYQSDFVAKLTMPEGKELSDFELEFSTNGIARYKASRIGDTCKNCVMVDEGSMLIIFKNHGLGVGRLNCTIISWLPCKYVADGKLKEVYPRIEEVELVDGASDDSEADIKVLTSYAIIDAYDMAVQAGYKGTREEYIKFISGAKQYIPSGVLHRKCISINSYPEEVYTGDFMRFPLTVLSYDVSNCIDVLSPSIDGVDNNGVVYNITGNMLTINGTCDQTLLHIPVDKRKNEQIKLSGTGRFVTGFFSAAQKTLSSAINTKDLNMYLDLIVKQDGDDPVYCIVNKNGSYQCQLFKTQRKHKKRIYKKQWVEISPDGTALSRYNKRKKGYSCLVRIRRCNSRMSAFGEWNYYHVIDYNGILKYHRSRFFSPDIKSKGAEIDKNALMTEDVFALKTSNKTIVGGINELSDGIGITKRDVIAIGYDKNLMASFLAHFNALSYYAVPAQTGNANKSGYTINGVLTETLDNYINVFDINLTTAYGLLSRIDASGGVSPNPIYNILSLPDTSTITSFKYCFASCQCIRSIPYFDCSSGELFEGCFLSCNLLTELPELDFTSATDTKWLLMGCTQIETLGGFKNISVNLDLSPCIKLTKESLLTVINNAKNMAEIGESRVLTLGVANLMKLSNEEKAFATNKGWTLA